jgi:hypothetical protein
MSIRHYLRLTYRHDRRRGDTLRAFDPLPIPREVGTTAQPGGPNGITYDPARDRF